MIAGCVRLQFSAAKIAIFFEKKAGNEKKIR
jgi:hypothetical protein